MIRNSIRGRLALWHTLVLALVVGTFSVETYTYLLELTRDRTDRLLQETARAFVHTFTVEADDPRMSTKEAARRAAREFRFSSYRVLVYSENHQLVAMSDSTDVVPGLAVSELTTSEVAPLHHLLTPASLGEPTFGTLRVPQRDMRAYAVAVTIDNEPYLITTLQLRSSENEIVQPFLQSILISIPLALMLAGVGGYFLARKSLQPVMAMTDQAVRLSSENLDERLHVQNPDDELGRLAIGFNNLLTRLEKSFFRQRQFMADASHELRTPIAIMAAETDVALAAPRRSSSEYRESLHVVNLEAKRMRQIVEDLFTLARADMDAVQVNMTGFYLDELLSDCVRAVSGLATAKGVDVAFTESVEAEFFGSEALIHRLVLNLLDNAIKYTPRDGAITMQLGSSNGHYTICVSDTGSGIPKEARPHIFNRFYRVDRSRRRTAGSETGGAGLGLSISKWIAEAHGGSLYLDSTGENGSRFVLQLPRSSNPARRECTSRIPIGSSV